MIEFIELKVTYRIGMELMLCQAIHGVVHSPKNLGVKYTWFGSGYLSNMYFKVE